MEDYVEFPVLPYDKLVDIIYNYVIINIMSRFTLKTYCGTKLLEQFDHRSSSKMRDILRQPRHHRSGETGPFGEILQNADKFVILNSQMESIFQGNVSDALSFIKTL